MHVSCGRPRWLWLLIAAATAGGGRAALAARVAVVTDGGAAVEQVIDLAQAKMASDVKSQAQFVERASIKKIFAEQKLSLSGVVDAGEAVKVGQLLGAEFLAVVETDEAHANATGVVLFDARTGERFEDDGLGGADEKTADALADSLRAGLRKAALPMKKRRPICLLTVRNVNLPKSQDAFCGAIARLVERRLLGSPDVVVLERERLNEVRKEEALHPGSGEKSELIASVVMMELQLERDNGQIRATCVLSDSMGKRVGAPMSAAEAGRGAEGVAEELAAMIGTALKVTAAPSADDPAARKAEALRFYHEARFWWTHHEYDRPVESMEAAVALDPENPLLQAQLGRALTLSGIARIGHFNDRAAETGRDVMIFIEPRLKPTAVSESLGLVEAGMQCVLAEGDISSTVESAQVTSTTRALGMAYLAGIESVQMRPGMGQPGMEPPLTTEEQFAAVRAIRRDYCTLLRRDVEAPAIEDVTDWKSAVQATSGLEAILTDPAFYNTAPRGEVIADLKQLAGAWKNMWAAHPPKGSPSTKAVLQLLDPKQLGPTLEHVTPFTMGRGRLSEADRESLLPVYESLSQINDPACAATAALGIAWATPPGGKRTGGSIPSQWLGAGSFRTPTELKPARGGTAVVAAPAGPDWAKKLLLLDVGTKTGNEERKISRPIAHGKYVYAVETMRMGRDVQYKLLEIDPSQPTDVQPAGIPADTRGRPGPALFLAAPDCIAGGYYILVGKPSVLFSLSGKGGIMLKADRGFDFRAGKVTVVDGKVFASDDGSQGMLVEYDIDAETMKTLAASKRTDVQSPFDNLPPLKIPMLLPDAARHRIVFFATGAEWPKTLPGLWEYNLKTGKFKELITASSDVWLGFGAYQPPGIAGEDKYILGSRILDLATNALTPVPDENGWEKQHVFSAQSPHGLTDHYVWTSWGRARLPDGLLQGFPFLALQAGRDSKPDGYFPLDDDRMIAYNKHSVWLLEPPKYVELSGPRAVDSPDEGLPPAIVPPAGGELPWSAVHVIYDHFRDVDPIDTYISPRVAGERIFVLGIGHDQKKALRQRSGSPEEMTEGFAQLLSFGRAGAPAKALGKLDLTGVPDERRPENRFGRYSAPPAVTALGRQNYYAAMAGEPCIGIFPLDGRPARKVGLPESAQHLVTLGGQLYAAIDHSYSPSPTAALSHIDPASGKIETLIATTLVQSESGPKHYPIVRGLWGDAARDRLLYLAQGDKPNPAADGIWEWKLATHQKRLLLPLYISDGKNDPLGSSEIVWTGSTADGHPLVASRRGLFEFDPATDSAKAIMQGATLLDPLAPTAITLTGRTVPPAENDLLSGRIITEMPYALADGFLWFSNGRCSLDGKIFEQFPHFRSGRDFLPDEIQFIDGGAHCLVSDEYGAWLLDIKK